MTFVDTLNPPYRPGLRTYALKVKTSPNKGQMIKENLLKKQLHIVSFGRIYGKTGLKNTIFLHIQKRPTNGHIILFLANGFKKAK